MITVRDVMHIVPDRMKDAKQTVREMFAVITRLNPGARRALTDVTGESYTLVLESEYPDMASYERSLKSVLGDPEFQQLYPRLRSTMRGGRRDIYEVFAER
jgi:hypothetical protein